VDGGVVGSFFLLVWLGWKLSTLLSASDRPVFFDEEVAQQSFLLDADVFVRGSLDRSYCM
jgi:hypothetical protein